MAVYHTPVLLEKSIEGLNIDPAGVYIDATFGGGGHSREIIKHLTTGKLLGFDRDSDAARNIIEDPRFIFVQQNFRFISNFLKLYGIAKVNGIIADLGISSHQIDIADRGFSIRYNSLIDLRMDRESGITGRDIINNYQEEELKKIFREYGELNNSGRIVHLIINSRMNKSIETIDGLKEVLAPLAPKGKENKFYAKIIQALRIEVNQELDALKDFLIQANELLLPGGRLVVISYHSLEDRLVKNFIKKGKFEGEVETDFYGNRLLLFKAINNSVIVPDEKEIAENSRARSAKLRIAEKI
ncbi:MAG: 16S rRNA (cytosine(1402)-N(4))-methyltransferase RsmH [Bacteroidota bacterium]|nr:16S rRNA (cytosine(1402)-N(4))-methyltransferase RsmH [Bacteroidota bacterium]